MSVDERLLEHCWALWSNTNNLKSYSNWMVDNWHVIDIQTNKHCIWMCVEYDWNGGVNEISVSIINNNTSLGYWFGYCMILRSDHKEHDHRENDEH